jgi:hypothetical protein
VGSNPIGSTAKFPANDKEIENSGRHAGGAVQQPCRNPSKSPELLGTLIARRNAYLQETYALRRFSGLRTSRGTSGWGVLHA